MYGQLYVRSSPPLFRFLLLPSLHSCYLIKSTGGYEGDDHNSAHTRLPIASEMAVTGLPITHPGALTKKMVATKERLEGDLAKSEASPSFPTISEAQRRKEREMVSKEIQKLQSSIQTLCRSANPLGKIMDYVQVSLHASCDGWVGGIYALLWGEPEQSTLFTFHEFHCPPPP